MQAGDWSLVLFTLLIQSLVGAWVTLVVVHWRIRRAGEEATADQLMRRLLPWLGALLAVAVAISLTHLGSPSRARYVLSNLGSSWLSREVLLIGLIAGCGALLGLLQWRLWGSAAVRRLLAWLAAALGAALVVTMSQVYMLATVPPWNRLATPLAFVSTAALLGVLTVLVTLGDYRSMESDGVRRLLDRLPPVLLGLIGLRLVTILITALPVTDTQAPAPSLWAPIMQAALLGFAASVLTAKLRAGVPAFLRVAVTMLVCGSELLGRIVFFASYWRVGI